MNNIYLHFVLEQPHSCELSGGKNDLFSPSPVGGSGENVIFAPLNLTWIQLFLEKTDVNVLISAEKYVVYVLLFINQHLDIICLKIHEFKYKRPSMKSTTGFFSLSMRVAYLEMTWFKGHQM